MIIVLAFYFLARPCCAASVSVQPGEPGTLVHPIVGEKMNVKEMTCNDIRPFNTKKSVEKACEDLVKEIISITIECGEDCSCVLPLTNNGVSKKINRLLCHFQKRPNVKWENALNHTLKGYHKCQDSVSKLPEANESNANTVIKDGGSTEMSMVNDNESTTKSEIEVVTDLKPTDNPVSTVSNPNGEVATTPNSTKAEATINNSTLYNEDLNSGTDNPKNGEKTTTPKPQNITETEATRNSTTDFTEDSNGDADNPRNGEVTTTPKPQDTTEAEATEDSGNSNGGTDSREILLIIAIVSAIMFIFVVFFLLYYFKCRSHGHGHVPESDSQSNEEESEL